MNGLPLFRSVETAAAITDRVLVAFSGGKDSVVTLDVCMRHFAHVEGFFMYQVRGLSFQESIIRYYEDKYGIPIHRIPHFELSSSLRYGLFPTCDIAVLFGDERLDELMGDAPDVAEAKSRIQEIKEHRAESLAKMREAQSADFYFTVVCESDAQKRAVLKALGAPDWESFVNGRLVAGRLGV